MSRAPRSVSETWRRDGRGDEHAARDDAAAVASEFTFADATRLVPYMARLGISHLYSSPILTARAGSMHGYDVTDPTRVKPTVVRHDDRAILIRRSGNDRDDEFH